MSGVSAISSISASSGSVLLNVSDEEAAAVERARERASPPEPGFLSPFRWIEKLFGSSFTADLAGLFQPLQQAGEDAGKRRNFLDMLGNIRSAEERFGAASLISLVEPLEPIAEGESKAEARSTSASGRIDIRV